jgi:hypothetical protein
MFFFTQPLEILTSTEKILQMLIVVVVIDGKAFEEM